MSPSSRRNDLDWLRVVACYLLLLFHVGMVFNPAPFFHIRNEETSFFFLVLTGFISLWHMPLFFLLAGWSAFASLRARGSSQFLGQRIRKLAIPLIAGCVLLVPAIKYVELRSGMDLNHQGFRVTAELQESFRSVAPDGLPLAEPFEESFLEFLPTFFTEVDRFSWSHLWFIAYLFAFSLVLLPLFRALLGGSSGPDRIRGIWAYAPILPLVAVQLLLRERWPGPYNLYADWANVSFYTTFLVSGFLIARIPAFERAIQRERRRALGVALATTGVLLTALLDLIPQRLPMLIGSAVAGWCFVVALLGFAHARLSGHSQHLAYLVDSAFPVYLLHQSAIVLLGYPLVQLPLGVPIKFVLLLLGSLSVTVAIYHLGVRPFRGPRALAGMKPLERQLRARAGAPALGSVSR